MLSEEFPVLQVALDFVNLKRAMLVAEHAVKGGADWLEAGTPLIKSEGMNAVRMLKHKFKTKKIVADMKTVDVGGVEVAIAAKAGADIICFLAMADDETVRDALQAAKDYGVALMADLMRCAEPVKRAKALANMGVQYVCVHVGVDEQMKGLSPLERMADIVNAVDVPVAAAGGINSETAAEAVKKGASIVIVGGAIIKAPDVAGATAAIKSAMNSGKKIATKLYKKYLPTTIKNAFLRVSTANISDAMRHSGYITGVRPIVSGLKMVGKALPVKTMDGDWAKPVEAIDMADKNTVIVISAGKRAVWGELATWSCKVRGIAGVVVDGGVRDVREIKRLRFPVFARHVAATAGEPQGHGEIGCDIICGGQRVRKGDWIIGDDDGVVVVPHEIALQIANRAIDVRERENRIREEIKQGSSLGTVLELLRWEKVV